MKVILEFNLPEESEKFELARNGAKLSYAISKFQDYIRSRMTHEWLGEDELLTFKEIREKLFEILRDDQL